MKIQLNLLILFTLLAIFACNRKQVKTDNNKAESLVQETLDTAVPLPENLETIKQLESESNDCEALANEILITSPRYLQLTSGLKEAVIKNGGTSFDLNVKLTQDTNNNNGVGGSKLYEFTISEIYPDRKLNTFRFVFNPSVKQLYEYDAVDDTLKPIEFDEKLVDEFNLQCK
jgi:hypothetical protein